MKKLGKNQIFIIVTIALLLIGTVLLSVLGFASSVDGGDKVYEMQVKAEYGMQEHVDKMKETCDKYFEDNGIKISSYATQKLESGETLIYKSYQDLNGSVKGVETVADAALAPYGLDVEVNAFEVNAYTYYGIGWVMLALGITLVAGFVYLLFMQKLSGALTSLAVSLISGLLYFSLLGITRIPCDPMFITIGAVAMILGGVLSIGIVGRCIELIKNVGNDKVTNYEIADTAIKKSIVRMAVVLGSLTVVAIAFIALSGYFSFLGVQLLLAILSAGFATFAWTPLIWPTLKKYKRNKRAQITKTEQAN